MKNKVITCPVCGCPFDSVKNILTDFDDGTILSGCPMCGEEVEVEN